MEHRKKHRLRVLFLSAVMIYTVLCGTAIAEKTGTVRGGWLNLRSAPTYSGQRIASYPTGTVVKIKGQSGAWYEVTAPDGLQGYMLGTYLKISGDDLVIGGDAWVTSENGLNVRLRSGNGTKYSVIASYAPGTKCTIVDKLGTFCKINIGSYTGYMMTKFLTATDPGSAPVGPVLYNVYVVSTNGRGVNLRSSPVKSNNVIGFYEVGTKAGMITPGPVWSRISIDGKTGYMMTEFLSKTKPDPFDPPTGSSYVISYNGKNVYLRSGPGKNYGIINSYAPGTPLTILTPGKEWSFIKIYGTYGYMMNQFIRTK